MCRLLIFGGTTEGRTLAEFCCENGITADISVATDHGAKLLPTTASVLAGRLDNDKTALLIRKGEYDLVLDATHPYALEITKNVKRACEKYGVRYVRVLRRSVPIIGKAFESGEEIVSVLDSAEYQNKVILSTLGSKSLELLAGISFHYERVWLRLLPGNDIKDRCRALGFDTKKLILETGPFSVEKNAAHIKMSGADIMLTKESGEIGGYPQKSDAALICKTELMTIMRPKEEGVSLSEAEELIMRLKENRI